MVTVGINQAKLQMEVDTGASVSIISMETYTQLWPEPATATSEITKIGSHVHGGRAGGTRLPHSGCLLCRSRTNPTPTRRRRQWSESPRT